MKPFLKKLAELFLNRRDQNMSELCFVFPTRRAGRFFQKYLKEGSDKVMLSPAIMTISEFFGSLSPLGLEDRISLNIRLYKLYAGMLAAEGREAPSFDDFAFFGDMILSDFNDVDNYMVDARKLFTNISDIRELDRLDYLTEEQREVLKSLFSFTEGSLSGGEDKPQQKFMAAWKLLLPLYEGLRGQLEAEGLSYDGMRNRSIAEQEKIETPYAGVIFAGFNAISEAQRRMFAALGDKADFYWDYSAPQIFERGNMAGYFANRNLTEFPSKLKLEEEERTKTIHVEAWSVPSAVGQCRLAGSLLRRENFSLDTSTAVVLSDENLLIPMLYNVPEEAGSANVTMTYPVRNSPAVQLMEDYLRMLNNEAGGSFHHKQVFAILNNPLVNRTSPDEIEYIIAEFRKQNAVRISPEDLARVTDNPLILSIIAPSEHPLASLASALDLTAESPLCDDIEKEVVTQCVRAVRRLDYLLSKHGIAAGNLTLLRLIKSLITKEGIAFEGEPLSGLQIMGMLETRCLDFDDIIICSLNEGIFPKADAGRSFIPHNLRRAFGLPSTEHQDSIFAYHFYRLIHGARKVYLLYDGRVGGNGMTMEPARYIKQLKYLYSGEIEFSEHNAANEAMINIREPQDIAKDAEAMAVLSKYVFKDGKPKKAFSFSTMNKYRICGLQFYYYKIKRLGKPDEIMDMVEENMLGDIFHDVMKNLYDPFIGQELTPEIIGNMIQSKKKIRELVEARFLSQFMSGRDVPITGYNKLITNIIYSHVISTLEYDQKLAPFTPIANEYEMEVPFTVRDEATGTKTDVLLQGKIDRIDQLPDGTIRICDYKTGNEKTAIKSNKSPDGTIFSDTDANVLKGAKQLYFYQYLYKNSDLYKQYAGSNIELQLYVIKFIKDGSETRVENLPRTEDDCRLWINDTIAEILRDGEPFRKTDLDKNKACRYCDYSRICY